MFVFHFVEIRPFFSQDPTNSLFDLENSRSRPQPRSKLMAIFAHYSSHMFLVYFAAIIPFCLEIQQLQNVTLKIQNVTRTTRTPAFWGYPPPPRDYPYYWPVRVESQVHTIDQFISDPKSKEGESRQNYKNLRKIVILEFCYKLNKQHTL